MFFPSESLQWFAIQVRSNHEKIANAILQQKGYRTFLPLYRTKNQWSDRTKILERPLFPGYLFCLLDPQRRQPVVTVDCVARIVGIGRIPAPVDAAELETVQRVLSSDLPCGPHRYIANGEPVRVVSGPLRGLQGTLESGRGEHRVVVSVHLIQRAVGVEVDRAAIVPVNLPVSQQPAFGVWQPGRCFG